MKEMVNIMDIFISSQNIYDREGKIVACELLYRNSLLNKYDESVSSETASCTIINNIINLGLDIVTGGKIALINCDDKVLRNDIITILPRDKVVIELLETLRPTEGVIKEIKRLKDFGFKLALDDIVDLNGEDNEEYTNKAVIRGRFCELIMENIDKNKKNDAFISGLLLDINLLLGKEIDEILDEIHMSNEVDNALRGHSCLIKDVLDIAVNYSEMNKEQINNLCKKIGIDKNILYKLYLQAMVWIKNL